MYRVIKHFTDLQDNQHPYYVGDPYPREGMEVAPSRIAELSTSRNRQDEPLIQLVDESDEKPVKKKRSTKKAAEK